jgi:uncharacterized membrane protein YkvA (DUF1232 family)
VSGSANEDSLLQFGATVAFGYTYKGPLAGEAELPGRTLNFVNRGKRESLAFARICVGGSPYRLAQLSLLIGLAYWVGPIDLIPARTPYVGHLDEACALIGALVIARRLAPDMLDSAADISATIPARRGVAESLPNFFIVGAARCGTTSLFTALGRHRDVFCCPVKEPNHFCSDRNAKSWVIESAKRRLVLLSRDQPPPPTLPRVATTPDLATYRGLFADWAGQPAVGEASTAYLLSADAARNIADAVPAARIIIVLRHPVHRAQSEYLMHAQLGRSRAELDAAIAGWQHPPHGELEALANIVRGSLYAPQIRRYLAAFPREQILFLLFDDVLQAPQAALRQVFEHIGVPVENGVGITLTQENESKAVRSARLNRMLARTGMRDTILHLLPPAWRRRLARRYYRADPVERPNIPAALFADDLVETEALIGRDLSAWRC